MVLAAFALLVTYTT